MRNFIHPTAVISERAIIGDGNYFGPFCFVGPKVKIGNNNRFEAYCSIGAPPEHKNFWHGTHAGLVIGNNCVFREFITLNCGTKIDTLLHDNIIMLKGGHVGHDSEIHKDVTMACNVLLAGHTTIYEGANLGLGVVVHQYSFIGQYSMLGMGTIVTKASQILPFNTYVGSPARHLKRNTHGIQRSGLSLEDITRLENEFRQSLKKVA